MSSLHDADAAATYRRHVDEAASTLRAQGEVPATALILSAAAPLQDRLQTESTVSCADLPHYPTSQRGHTPGTVTIGTLAGTPVVVLDTPLALHNGYTAREAAFPVRMLAVAGAETLLFAGSAAALRPEMQAGDLMLVTDHINLQGANPLVGPNVDDWGPRFPDMTEPYDAGLRRAAAQVARRQEIRLRRGVYLATLGPDEGTTAERRMMRMLGGDAMGSGLVPEVIAARHMGVRVAALATIDAQALPSAARTTADGQAGAEANAPSNQRADLLQGLVSMIGADNA